MSSGNDSLRESAKEFEASLKKLVSVTTQKVKKAVDGAVPSFSTTFDKVTEDVEKTVSDLVSGLDKKTVREQVQALQAYKKLLEMQLQKVNSRITELTGKSSSQDSEQK